ncbi:chromosome condensation complex protein [Dorcoceras hygrometricum]|uniref:Chromosome condensation complex protein n=1 Tax=Dorcoceras hygrometricum TaxID=472368 RepID=A0A2Z7AUJ5_9LAMI|nr:chromosome condensation complex protein [Dorcoceras hygrometricum]
MDIVIWTRARWACPSPLLILLKGIKGFIINIVTTTLTLELLSAPPPSPPPPPLIDRTCSDQFFEVNPSVLILSGLLVQADEGVSLPVVDLIDESTVAYREEPPRRVTNLQSPTVKSRSSCNSGLSQAQVASKYGPFNPYIPIRSTTVGKSRVAKDPIAMYTSWRSNSDIASVTSIGYPRMSASGESSTTMHRLLHASGSHPIPPPYDPNVLISWNDVVGVHCFVSADEDFSRYFVEEVQQLVKSICRRLRYDSVWFSWNDSVWIDSAEAFLLTNQQMHYLVLTSRYEKRVCISADEFFQAFFQSMFLTTTMDFSAGFQIAPSVQLTLEQQQSSSSSSSSSSLHFDATDIDATASSRPTFSPDLSAVFADFQAALSEQIFASQSEISSRMHKLEQNVRDSLSDQAAVFKSLSQEARQEGRTMDDVQTIRFNEFRKNVLTQNASIFQGLADVRQVVDAVNAKVDIMAKRVNDIQKDAEATKEALSHQLLEFQSSAQENHNVIHAQLSELVDYIHRGSADKKGESGSRGLQKPANTQKEGSAVTPSFEKRVQMTQRRIVQTILDADANRAMSQEAAERDRERRRKEAKSLKRRRKD